MAKPKKICHVGYVAGTMENGHSYGIRFDRLTPCCQEFRRWFNETGNVKIRNFDVTDAAPYGDRPGFNFVTRGQELLIELLTENPTKTGRVNFCPFCSAKIEVEKTGTVTLRQKTRQVPDGLEEVESR